MEELYGIKICEEILLKYSSTEKTEMRGKRGCAYYSVILKII